ncbi:MAG: glycoside hydrolase family 9 protein [Ruminococcus sp.]
MHFLQKKIKSVYFKYLGTALGYALSLLLNGTASVYAASDTAYRQLQDYTIFNGSGNLNWCGGDHLEVSNARVPIDHDVTYEGASSLRICTTDTSEWWSVRLVVRNWMSMDFSQYQPEGYLEFDVKGSEGNEKFQIGFADYVAENGKEDTAAVSIEQYAHITSEWQHVSIPLSDISEANPDVDFSDITVMYLLNDGTTDAQKFWITNLAVTSDGLERESPPIRVNQVGFLPDSTKYALVSFYPELYNISEGDTFSLCEAETGKTVYDGTLKLLSEFDQRDSGEKVLKADFSEYKARGTYYVSVQALPHSAVFSISDNVYEKALTAAQKYFYYQRQGIALEEKYAGNFARDNLGIDDASVPFASENSRIIASEKGWFDAGDSGKYINTGAGTVSSLLWAYEMYPQCFPDNALNIPESGNGIPDLLDEARWELEWILTMQDTESGGFYPRIQGNAGNRMVMDENGCTTDDTACAVGVLAEAYLSYKKFDSDFADKCLAAAEKGWKFLLAHPENITSYDVYVVSDDRADRLWAAGALLRASGNSSCNEYFQNNYPCVEEKFEDSYAYANGWGNNWLTGCWHYLLSDEPDEQVCQWLKKEITVWREILLTDKWENNIWGLPLHKGNYFRGITFEICSMAMAVSITDQILNLNDSRTYLCAETSLSWILGANPLSISYVSGFGENSVKTIHSEIYENDDMDKIPDGYMPQGPNSTALKNYSRFAAKCYLDNQNDWVSNEHTIYANAALVYLLAEVSCESEPSSGDVNADGVFSIADAVIMQKWLLAAPDVMLADWKAGDLCDDNTINVFDLCLMKKLLMEQ